MRKIGVVLGRGGHTAQTFALVRLLGPRFKYLYMIDLLDRLTPKKIQLPGRVLPVIQPRLLPQDSKTMSAVRTVATLLLSFIYILLFRPEVVVSCGTGLTVPIFYSAHILKVKTVFIESMSRVESLSITGRMLLGKTSLFFVQWPMLARRTHGTVYGGQLL